MVALLLLPAAGCVHLKGTKEHPAVLRIHVEGMRALDEDDLKQRLATHESDHALPVPIIGPLLHQIAGARQDLAQLKGPPPVPIVGPLLYGLRGSGTNDMVSLLDPDALAVDRQRVEAYCRDRGYYSARVTDTQVTEVGEGQVDVTIRVEEGEPVRVSRIDMEGLYEAPEAKAALVKPALREGDVFSLMAYDALRDQIKAALTQNGWATGEVTQEAQVLPEEHRATVRYKVTPGSRYRFGPILVAGTGKVSRERVRERAAQEIKIGDWYDERKLPRAQSRVFAMGVFGGVRVERGTPDPERGIVPIVVAVREAPFRSVRVGPKVGVWSSTRIDVSGEVGWTNRNFLGDLRKLDLSLTAGYAWIVAAPQKEGPIGTAAADFTHQGVWGNYVDIGAHLEVQRGLEQGYDYWAQIGRFSVPIHLTRRVTFIPSYNLEVYELSNPANITNPGDPNAPSPLLDSCTKDICLLSYLEERIDWDGRDDPLNTRRGFYTSLALQQGGHIGGYGYEYFKILPEARAYLPVGERSVLAARARLGAFIPLGETTLPPTLALFKAGGATSMRGYGQDRLSPMLCVTDPTGTICTNQWVPEGGNGLVEYSVEYRFPVSGNLFGATFLDTGYVSSRSSVPNKFRDVFALSSLQWAAGLGMRYKTPVGPIRVDLGVRLPNDLSPGVPFNERFPATPPSSQQNSPPYPGPHREPIMAVQFSVGEPY